MSRADRIPGYSDADMAALKVLARCQVETHKVLQELAHQIAALHGIQLAKTQPATARSQPDKAKRCGRHRYGSITRHARGDVTAEVVNEETGRIRRYHIVRADDGDLDVEEL